MKSFLDNTLSKNVIKKIIFYVDYIIKHYFWKIIKKQQKKGIIIIKS